jgi:hypothetical protein
MNETFEEYKYAIRHKPTKKWVNFKNDDLELTATAIELVDLKDCLIVAARDYLELFLKRSSFNNIPNYGIENFLEFELANIKVSYSIEENE